MWTRCAAHDREYKYGGKLASATRGVPPVITRSTPSHCTCFGILLPLILIQSSIHIPSTMSQPPRQDLIQNAILFLQDPKTQSSPLTSKIEFLQAKGLNEVEIQDALSRSSSSSPASTYNSRSIGESSGGGGYGMRYEMAPVPPKRDWRDLFVCPTFHCHLYMDIYIYI